VVELVGRIAETKATARLLEAAAAGESAALIIEGEPGIGKTTLWLDTQRRARQKGFRVLAARTAAAESVLAYAALADLLAHVDPALWSDLPPPQRHGLDVALLRTQDIDGPGVDQRAVGAALYSVLTRLAAESPVLVCIDDLPWLDSPSSNAIAFAARRLATGIGILCTVRSGENSRAGYLQLDRPNAVERIRLRPLTIGELQTVLTARVSGPIARSLLERIHHMSGGNPFYALELAREAEQRGPGSDLTLPDSLNELAQARISRIGPGADDVLLAIASLVAPEIPLVALAVGRTPGRIVHMLDAAETQSVVAVEGRRVRFTHPLLAHAVYLGAAAPRRREMHRRLAQFVTEPEVRARHLALADPAGTPETLAALDNAAGLARGRGAPTAAAELLELAIKLGGATFQRQLLLAECLFDSGEPRRAREVLEKLILAMPPGALCAEALQLLAVVRLYDDSFHEAAELGRRALANCPAESALRVNILTVLAFAELNTGDIAGAMQPVAEAVAVAERLGLSEPLGQALGMRAMIRFMSGDGVIAADIQRAVGLESPDTTIPLPFRPSVQSALLLGWIGEFDRARDILANVGRQCVAAGEEGELMFIAFQMVLFNTWRGDLTEAIRIADEALQRARQLGGGASMFLALSAQAVVAAHRGDIDDARRDLEAAKAAGRDSGYVLMMSTVIATEGFLEISLGQHARALAALQPLLPMAEGMPRFSEIIACSHLPDAAEAMINLDLLDDAERIIELVEGNGTRLDRAWMLAVGARCRAMLMAGRGDVVGATAHAHLAVTLHDRLPVPMPVERARTLLLLGRLERRLRHQRVATAVLAEALSIFGAVGAQLWADQAQAELDRSRSRPRSNASQLTPTEQRVADLAASGMSNRDIASALFVTRKTVEVNLSRIYRKLGIRSRTELYHVIHDRRGPANL
jgi:DNA-binding CsgD family transcriptional regulator